MNGTDRPLVGYVIIEVDYHEEREEPIHSFVSSPRATREQAERERDRREEEHERIREEEGSLYDAKSFSVSELKVHSLDQLTRMDEEQHEITMNAVKALGASLFDSEQTES